MPVGFQAPVPSEIWIWTDLILPGLDPSLCQQIHCHSVRICCDGNGSVRFKVGTELAARCLHHENECRWVEANQMQKQHLEWGEKNLDWKKYNSCPSQPTPELQCWWVYQRGIHSAQGWGLALRLESQPPLSNHNCWTKRQQLPNSLKAVDPTWKSIVPPTPQSSNLGFSLFRFRNRDHALSKLEFEWISAEYSLKLSLDWAMIRLVWQSYIQAVTNTQQEAVQIQYPRSWNGGKSFRQKFYLLDFFFLVLDRAVGLK